MRAHARGVFSLLSGNDTFVMSAADEQSLTPREQVEYTELRATIRERGTARICIFAAGLAMTTVFWSVAAARPPVILSFMFLVGVGTGVWGGFGPLFAELFPTEIRGTAMGSIYNLARGAQFVTPVLVTLIARRFGLAGGMSLAALFAAATAAWIWTFPETKGGEIR